MQRPKGVIDSRGKKQVGGISSGERDELVTTVCAANAEGQFIPRLLIFPRTRYQNIFLRGAPAGSLGFSSRSGWINDEIWLEFLEHFAAQTGVSKATPALLIIDNHSSHVNIDAVNFACENGIVLLTIRPRTTHKMQPLDVSVYGPFKNFYDKALDSWMCSHPGERFTIYHVAAAVNEAFLSAMTPRNIISGFKATGIWPYNPNTFTDNDFLPCLLEEEKDDTEQTEDPRYSYRIERSTDQDAAQPGSVSGLRNWLNTEQTNDMRVSFEEAEIILEPPSSYVTITSASLPTGEAEDIPGTSSSHDTVPRPSMFSQEAEDIPGTSSAHDAIPHPFTCSKKLKTFLEHYLAIQHHVHLCIPKRLLITIQEHHLSI